MNIAKTIWIAALIATVQTQCLVADGTSIDQAVKECSTGENKIGSRLLWYLPNRLADFADIFRARIRFGKGLGAGMRATEFISLSATSYESIYLGLPGPRSATGGAPPAGKEEWKGIYLLGEDATDPSPSQPSYSPSEIGLSLHLLLIGADVGFDPSEIIDFFAGLIGLDPLKDDRPDPDWKNRKGDIESTEPGSVSRTPAPEFTSWQSRFAYLNDAVTERISSPIQAADQYFASKDQTLKKTPKSTLRLGILSELKRGAESELRVHPDIDMDVRLPNLEQRLRLFVESSRKNELPGQQLGELDDNQLSIGFRRWFKGHNISTDAGIRAKLLPEAFARIIWEPLWTAGDWKFRPEQRFFVDSEEGLGTRTGFDIRRQFGSKQRGEVRSVSSAKWTTEREYFSWEQSFRLGFVEPIDPQSQGIQSYGWSDTQRAQGVQITMFGEDSITTGYRMMFGFRAPLVSPWLFWEIDPGLEWKRENEFEATYRLFMRMDLFMWGD